MAAGSVSAPTDGGRPLVELAARSAKCCRDAGAATVASTDRPIEPPTCWPTFSSADASPASVGATFDTAVLVSGTKTNDRPAAMSIIAGNRPPQYVVVAVTRENRNSATVANATPPVIRIFGPDLGMIWLANPDPTTITAQNGRNATPAFN